MNFTPTIGLEIHIELKTKTKMFCSCLNGSEEKHPNVNVCPICLGHPGTLPTINKEAVKAIIKTGLALNGKIAEHSQFDRKSYFYPDLPKGYQISQYKYPLVEGGFLNDIRIRRIHLEEDAGRLIHSINSSLVDFNRAGRPLMELVTEPDIKTADEAVAFAKELQIILRYLNVSDADMEKGQMRIEANISLSVSEEMGTKVEVKNINSFKAVSGAIQYEIERQEKILRERKTVVQETRGWDDVKKNTVSQRLKEESHGYRYFPEPDLPPLDLKDFDIQGLKEGLPELPKAKRERFISEFGLSREQVRILIENKPTADFFESAASELKIYKPQTDSYNLLHNYLISDLRGLMNEKSIGFEDLKITPEHLAHLVALIVENKLSSRLAKNILARMFETGLDPEQIIKEENLTSVSNENELEAIVREVILENPNAVSDFKKGKITSLQFLIGKAMAKTKGQASPDILQKLFLDYLSK